MSLRFKRFINTFTKSKKNIQFTMKSKYLFSFILILCLTLCNFINSQVVLNELCVSPTLNDGSFILPTKNGNPGCGEWIELYNKSCNPVDISGYILGTNVDGAGQGASFMIPAGKIIPPMGFAIIRGKNSSPPAGTAIDIVADDTPASNYCIEDPFSGYNMWFPDAGSWVGLYDKNGNVLDMIKWYGNDPTYGAKPSSFSLMGSPCIPPGSNVSSLSSYSSYGSGSTFTITTTDPTYGNVTMPIGATIVRIPDGGPFSSTTSTDNFSYGTSNAPITAHITYTTPLCVTQGVQLPTLTGTGAYTGGTYSSTLGLSIVSSTGQITPSSSTAGTYKVKYTLPGLACPGYDSTNVTIVNPSATATKTDPTCTGITPNSDGTITITASGGTSPYTYSKDGGSNYVASSTFNSLASNTYTLKAKDKNGCIATVSPNITLSVTCNCTSPVITTQPSSTTACLNANATFTVVANATASGYQWQVNSGSGWTNVVGQTTATLTLTSVTSTMNSYQYQCIVKEATGTCSVTSSAVTLTVDNLTATATKTNPTCNGATPNTNGTITITTSNGTSPYTFSSDNGVSYASTNPITGLASNTYTVKAKDANGCVATVSPNLTLSVVCPANPCIAPTIVTQPIAATGCVNTTAVFNVTASGTTSGYKWQAYTVATGWIDVPGATSSTLNVPGLLSAANGSKIHCIIQEATGNCPDTTNDVILTVDALPTSSSNGSLTVCNTNPGTVIGATAANGLISWSHNGGGSISGGTTLTPVYTPVAGDVGQTVVLTMTVTSNNSCNPATSQANFSIKVDPVPTAVAGGSLTICSNGTAAVNGASATNGTIVWSHNGAGSLTNQTTASPTYTANALDAGKAILLTMTVTSTTSCPNPTPATFTVNVDPLPKATAGGSKTICSNLTATVSGATSANGSILWTHDGSGTLSNATTLTPTYTPVAGDENKTVTLTLTVTSSNSCSSSPAATATYSVIVTPVTVATATAGGTSTICMTKTATISGANATNGTILWTHNGGGTLSNATTLTPTYTSVKSDTISPVTLTMTVTPNNACSNVIPKDTYIITVKSNPVVSPTSTFPCVGKNLQLNANSIVGGQYAWTGPNGFTNTNQTATINSVTLLDAGQYNLQIIDANNCVNSNSITVNIHSNPIITVDTLVCVGNKVQFSANTPPSVSPWSSQTSNLLTINNSTGEAIGVLGGIATVSYTDNNTCSSTKTIKVEDLPIVNFAVDSTSICLGNDVEFTDKSPKLNSNLLWDFGDGTTSTDLVPKHTYLKVDSFTVKLTSTSPAGCSNSNTRVKYITPIEVPTIQFSYSPDSIQIYLPEIKFTNLSNAKFYTWIFGDYSPVSNSSNPTHTFPNTPGEAYTVTLKGSNSVTGLCPASKTQQIVSVDPAVFFIPNSFTPNGDEINNTFQPIFTSGYDPHNYVFWIYNRWGELVFESHNAAIGWDGTYAGKMGENSTYVWKLQFKAKQTEKEYYRTGIVNLLK